MMSTSRYCPFYCEENAILLAEDLNERGEFDEVVVVFVSNAKKCVPLWRMRNGDKSQDGAIAFDYHCFSMARSATDGVWRVFDLDFDDNDPERERKDVHVLFEDYCALVLRGEMREPYGRVFRVVSLADIRREFKSDRSHMHDLTAMRAADTSASAGTGASDDVVWLAPPPQWPVLFGATSTNLFARFVDMQASDGVGQVMNQQEFIETHRTKNEQEPQIEPIVS
jgi:hypothetical protein